MSVNPTKKTPVHVAGGRGREKEGQEGQQACR